MAEQLQLHQEDWLSFMEDLNQLISDIRDEKIDIEILSERIQFSITGLETLCSIIDTSNIKELLEQVRLIFFHLKTNR